MVELAQQGRFNEVVAACERQRKLVPLSTLASHVYGVALTRLGHFDQAVEMLELAQQSSQAEPNAAQALAIRNDLSKAYFAAKRHDQAIEVLTTLRQQHPDEIAIARNLVLVLEESEQCEVALRHCRAAVERWPGDVQLAVQLADLLMATESWRSAADALSRVLTLDPGHARARRKLVTAYRRLDDQDAVTQTLREWLDQEPDNSIARHLLAAQESLAAGAAAAPARAPDDYVRDVFDQFAETFDDQLNSLGYAAPQWVRTLLARLDVAADGRHCVLDAGCGTGLMGQPLRPYASELVGVDLSPKMLSRARDRGYDSLVCSELGAFLIDHPEQFDLIVSMDTLIYFGELSAVFRAAHRALRGDRAALVFSLEKWEVTDPTTGYQFNASGRYAHHAGYVRETLERCGFSEIRMSESVLRKEAGKDVTGLYWTARKSGRSD
ncbi:Magnesium-protoporphyrin O-methyltransferase [Stieleria maiorica]|uniref:Magnesium-protoporphyrin O-methyltransferase n=1 Tax=Stieleria maiorica TaxID=2795974 RepID=A0A5B9MKE1_9BACT|nr:tetratricopeptide repeat protein [Stieleria maiorica]QEG01742.1 Magnesium-protoporphyrin O-methyltransferase [Stieleria maiorica]